VMILVFWDVMLCSLADLSSKLHDSTSQETIFIVAADLLKISVFCVQ
jgi:hypothetical protein